MAVVQDDGEHVTGDPRVQLRIFFPAVHLPWPTE